ncbi:hypothetical protein EP7_005563 (plasmid) [Isosphaeraceae bacterium EP7]
MFLTIERSNGWIRTVNLAHVGEWAYKPAGAHGPSCLKFEDPRGEETHAFEGSKADAIHATLTEMLASGKVASFRCKPPQRSARSSLDTDSRPGFNTCSET